jgi:glycosyltransferase involved in cell wall biosynthesis
MNLLFISHKLCWVDSSSLTGYSAGGGFPFQMRVISALFDRTRLLITQPGIPAPAGLVPLQGNAMSVTTLPTPSGGRWHKLKLFPWLWKNLPIIWREVIQADAVHAAVPGDVGSIGMVVALFQGKRLFVRHCGTFGEPVTMSDHLLLWLLECIAGGKRVVLATGGSDSLPSKKNSAIKWIFSTTLTQSELDSIPPAKAWSGAEPLCLVTACRLEVSKNVQSIIHALPIIQKKIPDTHLDVLGDGSYRINLEKLAYELGLSRSVTFHGNVNHDAVLKALSTSHLFLFPTQVKEGFPKAILEALACGLPVIATQVSVIPYLLQNGCGLLLQDTSAPSVAQTVLQMISDPARLARMGELACQSAQGYTLEAWGREIQTHLEKAWGPLRSSAG